MATNMTVANEILRQLGGNRFKMMTGAKQFLGSERSLSFRLPKAKDKIKGVKITLNGNDLYDISFGYLNKKTYEWVIVKEKKDIYNDMLIPIFETETGLYAKF